MKADHITVSGPVDKRKALTTGYLKYVSHSGADGAAAYKYKLRCLAILADTDVEEIQNCSSLLDDR